MTSKGYIDAEVRNERDRQQNNMAWSQQSQSACQNQQTEFNEAFGAQGPSEVILLRAKVRELTDKFNAAQPAPVDDINKRVNEILALEAEVNRYRFGPPPTPEQRPCCASCDHWGGRPYNWNPCFGVKGAISNGDGPDFHIRTHAHFLCVEYRPLKGAIATPAIFSQEANDQLNPEWHAKTAASWRAVLERE